MYAYTGQTFEQTEYLVECSRQITGLDKKLARAYKRYARDEDFDIFSTGHVPIINAERVFRRSMRDCDDTNALFEEIVDTAHTFFDQSDYLDIIDANL